MREMKQRQNKHSKKPLTKLLDNRTSRGNSNNSCCQENQACHCFKILHLVYILMVGLVLSLSLRLPPLHSFSLSVNYLTCPFTSCLFFFCVPFSSFTIPTILIIALADFQHSDMDSLLVDSIAPGSGDFPSISHMDESLNLPSFPPHSQGGTSQGAMPPIGEEFEVCNIVSFPSSSQLGDETKVQCTCIFLQE